MNLNIRLETLKGPSEEGWTYEVFDADRPEGNRVIISGIRLDWGDAARTALVERARLEARQ